jgi:hypothetical protein
MRDRLDYYFFFFFFEVTAATLYSPSLYAITLLDVITLADYSIILELSCESRPPPPPPPPPKVVQMSGAEGTCRVAFILGVNSGACYYYS